MQVVYKEPTSIPITVMAFALKWSKNKFDFCLMYKTVTFSSSPDSQLV